jgi:hypothetical protein
MKNDFINSSNMFLIWELLSEQDIIKNQTNEAKQLISNYVVGGLNNFYNNNVNKNANLTLIDINKLYIKSIILFVKNNYPTEICKIKIHNQDTSPISFKNIKEQRELEFNTKYNELQNDFTNMVTIKKPPTPIFTDNNKDEPASLNDMEQRIKDITMERNYDLQNIENINDSDIEKKNVSFLEDKSVSDNIKNSLDFFIQLDTDNETNIMNNNTDNDINLQNQINELKEKLSCIDSKINMILNNKNI